LRSDPKATLVTDADLFVDADSRETTGPLEPTVALAKKFPAQVLAFPHVAADTDRSVRMVGRELAETHVVRALTTGRVTNAPAEGMLPAAPRLQSGFIEGEAYIPPHMRFVDRLKEEAHREEMARGASEGRN
jgi:hypothetical protein